VNLKPLHDQVVVEQAEAAEKTASGIFIPDTAKEKPQEGIVVAVGPGRFEMGHQIPMSVKAGDRIIYRKYSGSEIKVDDKEYFVIPEKDILATVEKVPAGV
jgi:chaperonin GroES